MDSIITYLVTYNQYLINIIFQLLLFISKYIPLQQMAFDDSNSPEYQKFKVDKLPKILKFEKVDYKLLLAYYKQKYNKSLKPVQRRNGKSIPEKIKCPKCGAPHEYIYDNNGNKGQFQCKVCGLTFKETNFATKPLVFICPYCGTTLTEQKQRKHFRIHKCKNNKCSYYQNNLKKLPKGLNDSDKYKYKLHYIYREFTINFFKMDLYPISKYATGFTFKKFNSHIMGLCLTYHVNLKLSTRQTAHALKEVHGIDISHYQGKIDWERLQRNQQAATPLHFVFMKATEGGDHNDTTFEVNFANARNHGFIRGAYHFYIPGTDALKQADFFIRTVKLDTGDLPPVLDVEVTGRKEKQELQQGLKRWLDRVESHYGVKPILYTSYKFKTRYLDDSIFNAYPYWIAHYYVDSVKYQGKWNFWQHTDVGNVPGIKEDVDLNVFNGTLEDLKKLTIK